MNLKPQKQERRLFLQSGQAVLTPMGLVSDLWVTSVGHLYFTEGVPVSCCQERAYYRCQSCGCRGNLSDRQKLYRMLTMIRQYVWITFCSVWIWGLATDSTARVNTLITVFSFFFSELKRNNFKSTYESQVYISLSPSHLPELSQLYLL